MHHADDNGSGTTVSGIEAGATLVAPAGDLREDVVALAQSLIQVDTANPPGAEEQAALIVAARLEAAGIPAELQRVGDGRANLVARIRGRGERPGLMLSGHLDTVPVDEGGWTVPPRAGVVRDGRLYGRGALDMKGAVAAMVVTLERLHASGAVPAGDVVLALTAGEETDSIGARLLCEAGLLEGVGMAVIGEPTDLDIGIAHRGALWVRADAAGESAHGSQPSAGVNAVRGLLDWLDPIESFEALIAGADATLGGGSVSLNVIGGGNAPNVIPDQAHAILDFRTVGGHDHGAILDVLRGREGDVRLSILRNSPAIAIAPDDELVEAAVAASREVLRTPVSRGLPYMTDGSIFATQLGIRTVVLGPGTEADAHTDDESVRIEDLVSAARIYESIANQLLFD